MSFAEVLKDITDDVKGAMGAVVVGMDGIIVEEYLRESGVDFQSIGAEYGNILKEVQTASDSLRLGAAKELAVLTDSSDVIIRKINKDYFVAMMLSTGGNFGKGRFMVRKAVNRLAKEF